MAVAGNVVRTLHTILDNVSNPPAPRTGMVTPADITFTLHRESGAAMIAAGETVSMVEIGTTGHYYVQFTPLNSGLYVLQYRELNVNTLQRTGRFDFQILAAGSIFVPSYANAFCSEADIERWIQQAITASSKPSDTEAAGFAEARAAILMSLCARWNFSVTPTTVENGSRLQDLLREANAIGAAMDFTVAQFFTETPSKSDRMEVLDALWDRYVGESGTSPSRKIGYLEIEIRANLAALASNHILSGDTAARSSSGTPTDIGFQVTMGDTF